MNRERYCMQEEVTRLRQKAARMERRQRAAAARSAQLAKDARSRQQTAEQQAARLTEKVQRLDQPQPPAETDPDMYTGIDARLAQRMRADGVNPAELQQVVRERGYFREDIPVKDYPADFVAGWCLPHWAQIREAVYFRREQNDIGDLVHLISQMSEEKKAEFKAAARQLLAERKAEDKEHGNGKSDP